MTDLNDTASTVSSYVSKTVERKLVESIERRLGRVPSNKEVELHGRCFVGPVWTTYYWDGELLFRYWVRLDGFKHVIDIVQPVRGDT